jgi:hypothetical protein
VLVTHEGWPERDRRGQGRPDIRPALGPRSQLPGEQDPPPTRGQRFLLRPRRGLQNPRRALPHCLAARALGPHQGRRGSSPTGSGGAYISAAHASSTSSTTVARRCSTRSPGSSRAICGSRLGGRRSRSSPGFRTSSSSFRKGCARGSSARPFATRSAACTPSAAARKRGLVSGVDALGPSTASNPRAMSGP